MSEERASAALRPVGTLPRDGALRPDLAAPSDDTPERAEREAGAALDALGGAVTGPRRAIVDALLSAGRLRTPEQLLAEARAIAPTTSLATVYRTLERLDAAGRVKRATLASGAVGYAYCDAGHHEHAICVRCGRVERVEACIADAWRSPHGFQVDSHVLDFYGTCEDCVAEVTAAAVAGTEAGIAAGSPPVAEFGAAEPTSSRAER
jgi:Fur family ferric uptake transcriptional regulator